MPKLVSTTNRGPRRTASKVRLGAAKSAKPTTPVPLYKMPGAPVASRVKDLLGRMTLEEKAAQMMCVWQE